MTATAAHNGETYYAFLIQGPSGGSYSSVAGGGGASWTKQEDENNSSAHGMLFSDNVGAGHVIADLPALTVTFASPPVQAGHAVLVAMGNASGTPGIGHRTNSGGGDNPTASLVYFGPSAGNAIVFTLSIDNGGTYGGAAPTGYTLLASGVMGSGGSAIHWYTYAKYPSTGDGGAGPGDDRQLYLGLTGTNIHWVIAQVEVSNPGTGKDPYLLDHGAAAVAGNTLTFTAAQHGSFPPPTIAFVSQAASHDTSGSATSVTTALGATADAGDMLFAHVMSYVEVDTPSGWSKLASKLVGTAYSTVLYKIADGTETGCPLTWASGTKYGVMLRRYSSPPNAALYEIPSAQVPGQYAMVQTGDANTDHEKYILCYAWRRYAYMDNNIEGSGAGTFYQWLNQSYGGGTWNGTDIGMGIGDSFVQVPLKTDRYGGSFHIIDGWIDITTTSTWLLGFAVGTAPPVNTVAATLTGTARSGQTLTAVPGTWTGSPTPTITYQWRRCNSGGTSCSDIAGQTASTYVLTDTDVGNTIRVVVTGTNTEGAASSTTGQTSAVLPIAPVNTVAATLTGKAEVGQTLTAVDGTWSHSPALTYQWRKCAADGTACSNIVGATASTYRVVAGDIGSTIRVVVTGTNAGGSAATTTAQTAVAIASTGLPVWMMSDDDDDDFFG